MNGTIRGTNQRVRMNPKNKTSKPISEKELSNKIDALTKEIAALEKEIANDAKEIAILEEEIAKLN
jgi:hypothetical protein